VCCRLFDDPVALTLLSDAGDDQTAAFPGLDEGRIL